MFNFDFSELMVIGVVALVVIGPERLPRVARAAGYWVGRFQRFMNTLAEDINKEMEIDRLKAIQQQAEAEIKRIDERIQAESAETETVFAEAQYKIDSMGQNRDAQPGDESDWESLAESGSETTRVVETVAVFERTTPKAKEPDPVAEKTLPAGTIVADADGSEVAKQEASATPIVQSGVQS